MGVLDVPTLIFIMTLALVSVFLLHALARADRLRRTREPGPSGAPARGELRGHSTEQPQAEHRRHETEHEGPRSLDGLAELEAERSRIAAALEIERAARTREEAEFRARRREVMLALHRDRRESMTLHASESALRERVASLRTEVDHLERRLPELKAQLRASTEASTLLDERLTQARRDLHGLRLEHQRVCSRLDAEIERLGDLRRRRALLEAETEELTTLARMHEEATEEPRLLALITDGELRRSATIRDDEFLALVATGLDPILPSGKVARPG